MSEESVQSSGAEQTASTPSSEPASPQQTQSGGAASTPAQSEQNVPFHEHPRFKELVEQKNNYANQMRNYEQQLQKMQEQLQRVNQDVAQYKQPPATDPLLERLKGVDPEFGDRFERVDSMVAQIEQFQSWQKQVEAEKLYSQAISKLDNLFSKNNIPNEDREWYQEKIENQVYRMEAQGHKVGLSDIDNIFNSVKDNVSKFFDTRERKIRESYVSEKKKDQIPATQSGGAPVGLPTGKSMSPKELKAAIASKLRESNRKI